jgi:hypothetical protein
MRVPQWLKAILATSLIGTVAWALTDRMSIGERITKLEEYIRHSTRQLTRIEQKLDRLLQEK